MRFLGGIFCLTAIMSILSSVSYADYSSAHAQITCIPERGYFKLETANLPNATSRSKGPEGFYSAYALSKAPFTCTLGKKKIAVEGIENVDGKGPCGARAGQVARVLVDGIPVRLDNTPRKTKNSGGWFELTDCFERLTRVVIKASTAETNDWFQAEICQIYWLDSISDGSKKQPIKCREYFDQL